MLSAGRPRLARLRFLPKHSCLFYLKRLFGLSTMIARMRGKTPANLVSFARREGKASAAADGCTEAVISVTA
jgi:hypothetical protein